jgi:NitT/TauT family transport system permease protein
MSVSLSANEAATAPVEIQERSWLGLTAEGWARILAPLAIGIVALGGWEWAVRANEVPSYILPGPLEIGRTLIRDWGTLQGSLWITLQITFAALFVAAALGLALAVLFAQSRVIELSLFPYAVILQVTPIVAIAPLIIIWVDDIRVALLICAWIVAFFPILSNTTLGLNSADQNLLDLFRPRTGPAAGRCWRGCGCRRRCPISSAGCASQAGSR